MTAPTTNGDKGDVKADSGERSVVVKPNDPVVIGPMTWWSRHQHWVGIGMLVLVFATIFLAWNDAESKRQMLSNELHDRDRTLAKELESVKKGHDETFKFKEELLKEFKSTRNDLSGRLKRIEAMLKGKE